MGDGFHISILWLSLRMSENCQVLAVRNIASLNFNKQTEPRMMETSRKTKFIQEKKKGEVLTFVGSCGVKAFKAPGACWQLSVDHVCAVPAEATRGPSALSGTGVMTSCEPVPLTLIYPSLQPLWGLLRGGEKNPEDCGCSPGALASLSLDAAA